MSNANHNSIKKRLVVIMANVYNIVCMDRLSFDSCEIKQWSWWQFKLNLI